jgi:hypothetical protein
MASLVLSWVIDCDTDHSKYLWRQDQHGRMSCVELFSVYFEDAEELAAVLVRKRSIWAINSLITWYFWGA